MDAEAPLGTETTGNPAFIVPTACGNGPPVGHHLEVETGF